MSDTAPDKRPTSPKIDANSKAVVNVGVIVACCVALGIWINGRLSAVELQVAGMQSSVNILLQRNGVAVSADENKVAASKTPSNRNP